MLAELLEMYRDGAITGYQVMLDCLHMLDSVNPNLILGQLPEEILQEMLEYCQRYDPSRMCSNSGPAPSAAQVREARRWLDESSEKRAKVKMNPSAR